VNKMDKRELAEKLINHYDCFNTEKFWLDEFDPKSKYVSVCCHHNIPHPAASLCVNVEKYIRKLLGEDGKNYIIFVGAYVFDPNKDKRVDRN